jgi:hypothetical protein
VIGNRAVAISRTGAAKAAGGGIFKSGTLTVRRTSVIANPPPRSPPAASAQGAGIYNGEIPNIEDVPVHLTIQDSLITHNHLTGSPRATLQGGGLYTAFPLTLTNTPISHNAPGQCFGC